MKAVGSRARMVVWALFLIAAFVTTHLPPPRLHLPPDINDKLLHCGGFAALGILTIWRRGNLPRITTLRSLALSFAGLAAYGIFDEATQPYFGRTFDLMDWAADIVGAAVGIAVIVAYYRFAPKAGELGPLG